MNTEMDNAKALVERNLRIVNTQNLTIVDDHTNEVTIPGFPYRFKAVGDKMLVAVDIFKSGYECKKCKGTGTLHLRCSCEDTSRPGFKYSQEQIDEADASLGFTVAKARTEVKCPVCFGDFVGAQRDIICDECQGKQSLIHMPDTAKSLPTTGVIVSLGTEVNPRYGFKNHDRVLFGAYTGVMIPTKAPGVVFKVLRDIEVLCTIKGGEDLATFDFVDIDKPLN